MWHDVDLALRHGLAALRALLDEPVQTERLLSRGGRGSPESRSGGSGRCVTGARRWKPPRRAAPHLPMRPRLGARSHTIWAKVVSVH